VRFSRECLKGWMCNNLLKVGR